MIRYVRRATAFSVVRSIALCALVALPHLASAEECTFVPGSPRGSVTLVTNGPVRVRWGDAILGESRDHNFRALLPQGCVELSIEPLDGKPSTVVQVHPAPDKHAIYRIGVPDRLPSADFGVPPIARRRGSICRASPFLEQALEGLDAGDLARATSALQRAISAPETCTADLAAIYRLYGFVRGSTGQAERCVSSLQAARALGADLGVLDHAPDAVKACRDDALRTPHALAIKQGAIDRDGDTVSVQLEVDDSLQLADRFGVYFRAGPKAPYALLRLPLGARIELPALAANEAEFFVVLMDRWGGWLATTGTPVRMP